MANLRVVLISGLKLSVSDRFININKVVIYNLGMFLKKIRRWYQNYFYLIVRVNYAARTIVYNHPRCSVSMHFGTVVS